MVGFCWSFTYRIAYHRRFIMIYLFILVVVEAIDLLGLDSLLFNQFIPLVFAQQRIRLGWLVNYPSEVHLAASLCHQFVVAIGNEPQYLEPLPAGIISPLDLFQMICNFVYAVFDVHLICGHLKESIEHAFQLRIDLMIEIGLVKSGQAVFLFQQFAFFSNLIDLVDQTLQIQILSLLIIIALFLNLHVNLLQLLRTRLLIILRLARLVLPQVILLQLLQQLQILCLCYFLTSYAHMRIPRGDSAHRHVGQVKERHLGLVDLEFLFFEEVKVQQFLLLLIVLVVDIVRLIVLVLGLYLIVMLDGIVFDVAGWRADISEVIE